MTPSLHIGISHAAHLEPRRRALAELLETIGDHPVHVEARRAPTFLWSEWLWSAAAADEQATHALLLQDDLELAPNLIDRVHALLEAHPTELLSLYQPHGEAPALATQGVSAIAMPAALGTATIWPRAKAREAAPHSVLAAPRRGHR